MLVLTRKSHEMLVIGDNANITVKILGVQGNLVRLGIDAPKQIPVHRKEIHDRIQKEKKGK